MAKKIAAVFSESYVGSIAARDRRKLEHARKLIEAELVGFTLTATSRSNVIMDTLIEKRKHYLT